MGLGIQVSAATNSSRILVREQRSATNLDQSSCDSYKEGPGHNTKSYASKTWHQKKSSCRRYKRRGLAKTSPEPQDRKGILGKASSKESPQRKLWTKSEEKRLQENMKTQGDAKLQFLRSVVFDTQALLVFYLGETGDKVEAYLEEVMEKKVRKHCIRGMLVDPLTSSWNREKHRLREGEESKGLWGENRACYRQFSIMERV